MATWMVTPDHTRDYGDEAFNNHRKLWFCWLASEPCYLNTVDGEHEAVLHYPGHSSSQHVGASGSSLWQTLIVRFRVLWLCILCTADQINSLYFSFPSDPGCQASHDTFWNSPESAPKPSNFCPGRGSCNPGIIRCGLRCHPTPPHKSICFHEKRGDVLSLLARVHGWSWTLNFYIPLGSFHSYFPATPFPPLLYPWQQREPGKGGRDGKRTASPTTGRDEETISDWLR